MPRTKRRPPGPDERLTTGRPEEVRGRLAEFVRSKFDDNWTFFAQSAGIPVQTVESWKPAKDGWPSFQHLQRLAQLRLSVDWLLSGHGPMQIERIEVRTEAGKLLQALRPYLQRLAGVGEVTEDLAFARMLVTHRVEGLLGDAARGVWPLYAEATRDLKLLDETVEWRGWLYSELRQLRHEVEGRDAEAVETILTRVVRRLETAIPEALDLRRLTDARNAQRVRAALRLKEEIRRAGVSSEEWSFALESAEGVKLATAALGDLAAAEAQSKERVLAKLGVIESALMELVNALSNITARVQRANAGGKATRNARRDRNVRKRPRR